MRSSFRYHFDRRTIIVSILALVLCAGGAVLLYMLYMGGFFSAWFVSFVMAIFALMILSIPRRIILLDNKLEIQCVFDITEIDLQEISRIRKVSNRRLRWTMLLFGSSGFCGYYGKFFDLKEFEVITIYSSEWNNFVEITDIYDSRIYVSCREADKLITAVRQIQNSER
jgi:phosphate/sulfate permease